jgi:metallo-beta-lactamase class B
MSARNFYYWLSAGALAFPACLALLSYFLAAPEMHIPLVLILAAIAGATTVGFVYAIKSRSGYKRILWRGVLTAFTLCLVVLGIRWKVVSDRGGQVRQAPFLIADNLYYVGTTDVTSFLITGPDGHILIDGGYPGTADSIMKNIALLGFRMADVKILLNSHGHLDHAGGLAALQKASGAELWVSKQEAEMISSGGASSRNIGLMNFLVYTGLAKYPAPRIDHLFDDGAVIRLGATALTAHITPGHTPGCTTWSFYVRDGGRKLMVVSVGSLTLLPVSRSYKAQQQRDFRQSFQTLRSLPADIFLGSHAGFFNLRGKLKARDTAVNPVAPFIDREGYLKYISQAEEALSRSGK